MLDNTEKAYRIQNVSYWAEISYELSALILNVTDFDINRARIMIREAFMMTNRNITTPMAIKAIAFCDGDTDKAKLLISLINEMKGF